MCCWVVLITLLPGRLWAAERAELIEKIGKLNWFRTSAAEIQEILQTPDWEATVWDHLAELGMEARGVELEQRLVKEVLEMERRGESGGERVRKLQRELEAETPKLARAVQAEQEFVRFTDGLARLMDKRVVRLLGPFLFEQEDSTVGDDYRVLSTRDEAISTIAKMARRGLSLPTTPPGNYSSPEDVEKWRQWWATNKEQFGEVLRLPPATATTEPAPKTAGLAKSETTASPKPAISQVTAITKPGGQSSKLWMLISIGVLLLAGLVVFATRVTRKQ